MASAKNNQLVCLQGPHFSPRSTAKTNGNSTNLRKNGIYWYKWCCERFSKLRKNSYEEVDDDDDENDNYYISSMNKSQEAMVFHGHQKLTFAMKQRPEKWW